MISIPKKCRVVSFDVFDTVITRITAEPKGIFLLMRDCLSDAGIVLPSYISSNFAELRIQAEIRARRISPHEEITLYEIYQVFGHQYGLTAALLHELIELEIRQEIAAARAVPSIVNIVESVRKDGRQVAFLSDMYLPVSTIGEILRSLNIYREGDHLHVSNESRKTKRTGRLFRHYLAQEGLVAAEVYHIGDNPESDYTIPLRIGIDACLWSDVGLNRYEKLLVCGGDNSRSQLIAGASRLARLENEDSHLPVHGLRAVGANIAGPVLAGYVAWVLSQASDMGIRRLYFVSRDGQVLLEIARCLITSMSIPPIELRYLYGSRQAWHLPAINDISSDVLDWITLADPTITLRILAERLGSDVETVSSLLCQDGYKLSQPDIPLAEYAIHELRAVITQLGEFSTFILDQASKSRGAAKAYFRQEGLHEGVSWAMVDMGWNGRLQDSLRSILQSDGYQNPVDGFYFGLFERGTELNRKHAFFFGSDLPQVFTEWGASFVAILEVLTAADHGMTSGYLQCNTGEIIPVRKGISDHIRVWGIDHLRAGINSFVRHIDNELAQQMAQPEFAYTIRSILAQLQLDPSVEEAESLGVYPFSSNQAETVLRPFAPPLSFSQALRYLLVFDGYRRFSLTFWLHGSRKRSSWHVNLFLALCSYLLRSLNSLCQGIGIRKIGSSA